MIIGRKGGERWRVGGEKHESQFLFCLEICMSSASQVAIWAILKTLGPLRLYIFIAAPDI